MPGLSIRFNHSMGVVDCVMTQPALSIFYARLHAVPVEIAIFAHAFSAVQNPTRRTIWKPVCMIWFLKILEVVKFFGSVILVHHNHKSN